MTHLLTTLTPARIAVLASIIVLTGCSRPPVTGGWEHEDSDAAFTDSLIISHNGNGQRDLNETTDDVTTSMTWEIEWEQIEDFRYEARLDCMIAQIFTTDYDTFFASDCSEAAAFRGEETSFEVVCLINDDEDELFCSRKQRADNDVFLKTSD